uniref:uncharacterized protein LOC120817014 n=1 Tax=Gasterosteus aculeatus aculeatus TaxID=481459 RepID=UPI001A989381|nr:uncharacterized protein LOC120817014 [Gasterosteus aculeatus aculeatus]
MENMKEDTVSTQSSERDRIESDMAEALVSDALDMSVDGICELNQKIALWKAGEASRLNHNSIPTIEDNIQQYLRNYYNSRIMFTEGSGTQSQDGPSSPDRPSTSYAEEPKYDSDISKTIDGYFEIAAKSSVDENRAHPLTTISSPCDSVQAHKGKSGGRPKRIFKAMKKAFGLNRYEKCQHVESKSVPVHRYLILSPILSSGSEPAKYDAEKSEQSDAQRSQETAELDNSPGELDSDLLKMEKEVGVTRPKTPLQVKTDKKRPPSSTQRFFLVEEQVKVTQPETPIQVKTDKKPSILKRFWRFLTCSNK